MVKTAETESGICDIKKKESAIKTYNFMITIKAIILKVSTIQLSRMSTLQFYFNSVLYSFTS